MSRTKSEYQRQKKIWYKRLKDSGFEDIEKNEYDLKVNAFKPSRYASPARVNALTTYYSMATNLLNDYKFESNFEQVVWEYHANGLSIRSITKLLRQAKIKTNRTYVWKVITKLRTIMKKMYMK